MLEARQVIPNHAVRDSSVGFTWQEITYHELEPKIETSCEEDLKYEYCLSGCSLLLYVFIRKYASLGTGFS
jgi:hypothetical protein